MTINEAALFCQNFGLNRTKKTIRSWAQNGHVTARKQTTGHGEMWVLEVDELTAKIKAELEFAEQSKKASNSSEPVHTRSHSSEPVRNRMKREDTDDNSENKMRSLKNQINALTIDVKWRDQMLDKLDRENEKMIENLQGQARYIGHLETDLIRLGGEPDQKFLSAPTASIRAETADEIEPLTEDRAHPDQQSLDTG